MGVRLSKLYMYVVALGKKKEDFLSHFGCHETRMPEPKIDEIKEMQSQRASLAVFRWLLVGKHVAIDNELFNEIKDDVIPYCSAGMEARLRVID